MEERIKCPFCGFFNLSNRSECVKCRKPLNFEQKAEPTSSGAFGEDDSLLNLAYDESSSKDEARDFEPKEAELTDESEAIAEADVISSTSVSKEEPQMEITDSEPQQPNTLELNEDSLSHSGTDSELREISRFFKEAKEQGQAEKEKSVSEPIVKSETEEKTDFLPSFETPLFSHIETATPADKKLKSFEPLPAKIIFRLLAGLVDFLNYLLIAVFLILSSKWALGLDLLELKGEEFIKLLVLPLSLMMALLIFFYQFFFTILSAKTPGQLLFNLELETIQGQKPNLKASLIRAMIYLLMLVPLGLGFILILFGISPIDRLSQTRVVRWH